MILLVMGVTGSGKSTVGKLLADQLDWLFLEADDFHSMANKEKMHRGVPLSEADRLPWLRAIHAELLAQTANGRNIVLACSALRKSYRRVLTAGLDVKIVYLRGSRELIGERLRGRMGHFAGEAILGDQFAVLEEPSAREAMIVDIQESPEDIAKEVLRRIKSASQQNLGYMR
jgi:gluconokinase